MTKKERYIKWLRNGEIDKFNRYRRLLYRHGVYYINLYSANLSNSSLSSADLHSADLRYANLHSADLRYADLRYTNLSNANLHSADLRYADLRYTNLSNANLHSADLRYTDLRYTNLRSANLKNANLSNSSLSSADLHSADLRSADLSNVDLHSADLRYAKIKFGQLSEYQRAIFTIVPQGAFFGYKKVYSVQKEPLIIKIKIPAKAKRMNALSSRKCRCEYAVFDSIVEGDKSTEIAHSSHRFNFKYGLKKGTKIEPNSYDERNIECSNGIHFFITLEEAKNY